jgi:hypothetical protein
MREFEKSNQEVLPNFTFQYNPCVVAFSAASILGSGNYH